MNLNGWLQLFKKRSINSIFRTPERIALVGNGPSACKFGNRIDLYDFVVRITQTPHYGNSGFKTDALAIINWSGPGYAITSGLTHLNERCLASAREIWLPMPQGAMASVRADQEPDIPPWPGYADFTDAVISKYANSRPIVCFPTDIWFDLERKLRDLGADRRHAASTGALVLAYLTRAYPRSMISLFGFTHEGWLGHPWAAEAQWIKGLANVEYGER